MTAVDFENVSKRLGNTPVLEDVSLSIRDGEFFTFVGPSGCGKSTLLNLVAGLETPSSGILRFDGTVINALPARERDVAMVFQNYALYPHLSVGQNIAFPLTLRKLPKAEIRARVAEIAGTLGLDDLLERKPRDLSGGQRQRVALGRALIRKPRVFLMDEPLSNLDARLRIEMRSELRRLHRLYRITTIYVTHDQEEAMALSDRMAVLGQGHIQQCGPPQEVYDIPANAFVAGFVGTPPINLIRLPWAVLARSPAGSEGLMAGIRPRDITVTATPQSDGVEMEVLLVESTGGEQWVRGRREGQEITGRADPGTAVHAGQLACFAWSPQAVHWFEESSGARRHGVSHQPEGAAVPRKNI